MFYFRYRFRRQDLISDGNDTFFSRVKGTPIPMVLDWAIRDDGSCQPPPPNGNTAPACVSANSLCVNAIQGRGYLCNCSEGYKGNPYVTGANGCTSEFFFVFKRMLMLIFSKKSHKFFHVSWTGDGQYMVTIHIFSAGACLHDREREIVMEILVF